MSGDFFDPGNPDAAANLVSWRNPLIGRGAGRQILQIPFDDSIDGTNALECFFQMPTQVKGIKAAQVWVQAKPFRQYVKAASANTSSDGSHQHYTIFPAGVSSSTSTGDTHSHTDHAHNDPQGGVTAGANPLLNAQGAHGHTYNQFNSGTYFTGDTVTHNHTLTASLTTGIFETAASGTLSLFVADNGSAYGSSIVSGVAVATGITKQTLLPQLTKSAGDKRIKITGTALCRIQVLLLLDLRVSVLS